MKPIVQEFQDQFVAIIHPKLAERLKQELRLEGLPETLPDWVIVVDKLQLQSPGA